VGVSDEPFRAFILLGVSCPRNRLFDQSRQHLRHTNRGGGRSDNQLPNLVTAGIYENFSSQIDNLLKPFGCGDFSFDRPCPSLRHAPIDFCYSNVSRTGRYRYTE
jgi:hypothetical protein